MKAYVDVYSAEDRALAEGALRRLGCTEFSYNLDDIDDAVRYAVLQVFDYVEHGNECPGYEIDASHPLMVRLKQFVDRFPDCYVLAMTLQKSENDGRVAYGLGADWWVIESSIGLDSNWEHAKMSHDHRKGIPSWAQEEVATATVALPVVS